MKAVEEIKKGYLESSFRCIVRIVTYSTVFTDGENLLNAIQYEVPLGKSDRICLTWDMTTSRSTASQLNYWKGDYEKIRQGLQVIDWETELHGKDVTSMWNTFRYQVLALQCAVKKVSPKLFAIF